MYCILMFTLLYQPEKFIDHLKGLAKYCIYVGSLPWGGCTEGCNDCQNCSPSAEGFQKGYMLLLYIYIATVPTFLGIVQLLKIISTALKQVVQKVDHLGFYCCCFNSAGEQ
jgi:hypothetical protein